MNEAKLKIKGIPKCDWSKYNQPVNINKTSYEEITRKMAEGMEAIIEAQIKQAVGIDVDTTELEKAMCYDRQQYEKGWNDAMELIGEAIIELYDEHCGNKIISLVFEKAKELLAESEIKE